jgi:hypothetical protein
MIVVVVIIVGMDMAMLDPLGELFKKELEKKSSKHINTQHFW